MEAPEDTVPKTPGIQGPVIADDDVILQQIFPPELWNVVIGKLTNSNDLYNLADASWYFGVALQSSRCLWMFAEVFPILFPLLDLRDVLKCRAACSLWKNSTDDFLQNIRFLHPLQPPSSNGYQISRLNQDSNEQLIRWDEYKEALWEYNHFCALEAIYEFGTTVELQNFGRKVEHHSGNPILTRSMRFHHRGARDPGYWTEAFSLLKRFGKEVWYLHLSFGYEGYSPLPALNILRRCLVLVPNLRGLRMQLNYWSYDPERESEENIMHWKRKMDIRPLPKLPKLEMLEIDEEGCCAISVLEKVAKFPSCYYNHLQSLSTMESVLCETEAFYESTFPNLTELHLSEASNVDLVRLKNLKIPLKRVSLHLWFPDGREYSLPEVFLALMAFRETLTMLAVDFRTNKNEPVKNRNKVSITFPQLRILSISGFCKDFLCDLEDIASSLPPFNLDMCADPSQVPGLEDQDTNQKSIWNLMPSVRTIRCRGYNSVREKRSDKVYTRTETKTYER